MYTCVLERGRQTKSKISQFSYLINMYIHRNYIFRKRNQRTKKKKLNRQKPQWQKGPIALFQNLKQKRRLWNLYFQLSVLFNIKYIRNAFFPRLKADNRVKEKWETKLIVAFSIVNCQCPDNGEINQWNVGICNSLASSF